jgi:hypothetical protein
LLLPFPILFLTLAHCAYLADLFLNHRPADSLWGKAVEALGGEDKHNVDFNREDKLAILKDVLDAVNEKKRICLENRWRYKKGKKEIIIRDQLEKVTEWVNKFKEVGDNAMQYDPAHAALPWAGVRFFLQVRRLKPYLSFARPIYLNLGDRQRYPDVRRHGRRDGTSVKSDHTLRHI